MLSTKPHSAFFNKIQLSTYHQPPYYTAAFNLEASSFSPDELDEIQVIISRGDKLEVAIRGLRFASEPPFRQIVQVRVVLVVLPHQAVKVLVGQTVDVAVDGVSSETVISPAKLVPIVISQHEKRDSEAYIHDSTVYNG